MAVHLWVPEIQQAQSLPKSHENQSETESSKINQINHRKNSSNFLMRICYILRTTSIQIVDRFTSMKHKTQHSKTLTFQLISTKSIQKFKRIMMKIKLYHKEILPNILSNKVTNNSHNLNKALHLKEWSNKVALKITMFL